MSLSNSSDVFTEPVLAEEVGPSRAESRPRFTSRKALTGFLLTPIMIGLWFITDNYAFLLVIPCLGLACLALWDISRNPAELKGKGLAITTILTQVVFVPIVYLLVVPGIQEARQAANRLSVL